MQAAIWLAEKGYLPEWALRKGIRKLLGQRLDELHEKYEPNSEKGLNQWIEHMRSSPVALVPEKANEQHYEVPPEFFLMVLGPNLKYSSAFYPTTQKETSLEQAEKAMLQLTCERARLQDGQDILELGCGWGSLSLWMAKNYPKSRIIAVSNSGPQREYIMSTAAKRGLNNLQVITCDMNDFKGAPDGRKFDRVVTVEMFEHMRNWESLFERISHWLKPEALMFMHVFAHVKYPYAFEVQGPSDWMSEHFFSGGMMPCHDMISRLDKSPLIEQERWIVNGNHYAKTCEAWLQNMYAHRPQVLELFRLCYPQDEEEKWFQRWKLFFLACAELFAYNHGDEWIVSHHLLGFKDSNSLIDNGPSSPKD